MDTPDGPPMLRIGELSRRLGVSDHVLRAWESRYGLLQPVRSAGGFRLYSEAAALRVRPWPGRRACPRRVGGERAVRCPAAGPRRLRRASRPGSPGPARV